MAIHDEVLNAALRICRARGVWTFRPAEIVAALPAINPGSVRTHVMSRCCVNAPAHHAHRWSYFHRLRRGEYEILAAWRRPEERPESRRRRTDGGAARPTTVTVRESGGRYVATRPGLAERIHGASLDELAARLQGAIDERADTVGHPRSPVLMVVELEADAPDPVLASYAQHIDRTLVRQGLRMTHEQRLRALQRWMDAAEEVRGVAKSARSRRRR